MKASRPGELVSRPRRLFFALPISTPGRRHVSETTEQLRKMIPGLRWVAPDNFHITLMFFGNVRRNRVPALIAGARSASSVPGFDAVFAGIGRFPQSGARVRVLHIPMIDGGTDTYSLRNRLHEAVGGSKADLGRFVPHLTVGRAKGRKPIAIDDSVASALGAVRTSFTEQFDRLLLYESHLSNVGATYEVVEEFGLAGWRSRDSKM